MCTTTCKYIVNPEFIINIYILEVHIIFQVYVIIINIFYCMLDTNIYEYTDVHEYKYADVHTQIRISWNLKNEKIEKKKKDTDRH